MRLSPPTETVFWISVALVVLGILAVFVSIPLLSENAFWVVVIGYIVLFLGNTMKGV